MSVVVGLLVGAVTVRFLRIAGRSIFDSPLLQRGNHRGVELPTAGGILLVLTLLVVEAGRAVLGAIGVGDDPGLTVARSEVLFAVLGFGFLGLLDDLLGSGNDRGFRGHLRALTQGRITTGFVKLLGGAGVAVVLVATPGFATGRRLIVDALLIALAANLGNLLDLAPGRTIKSCCRRLHPAGDRASAPTRSAWPSHRSWAPRSACCPTTSVSASCSATPARWSSVPCSASGSCSGTIEHHAHDVLDRAHRVERRWPRSVSFSRVIDRVGPLRALRPARPAPRCDDGPGQTRQSDRSYRSYARPRRDSALVPSRSSPGPSVEVAVAVGRAPAPRTPRCPCGRARAARRGDLALLDALDRRVGALAPGCGATARPPHEPGVVA